MQWVILVGRIIIIDDSIVMRRHLKSIFSKAGYTIVGEAQNAQDGIKLYKDLKPDLVTMDITMPGMNGIEAVKKIMAFDPGAKIVMVSAMSQKNFVFSALEAGARNFVVKPFNSEHVLSIIYNVLATEQGSYSSSKIIAESSSKNTALPDIKPAPRDTTKQEADSDKSGLSELSPRDIPEQNISDISNRKISGQSIPGRDITAENIPYLIEEIEGVYHIKITNKLDKHVFIAFNGKILNLLTSHPESVVFHFLDDNNYDQEIKEQLMQIIKTFQYTGINITVTQR